MANLYLDNKGTVSMLKAMLTEIHTGIVCTTAHTEDFPDIESMKTKDVDQQGNIWYMFSSESPAYKNLQHNNNVTLIYTLPIKSQLVRIIGKGEISRSVSKIYQYWSNSDEKQFEQGRDDPRIRLLKINVESSQCLKFSSNSIISILKLLGRAIGGRDTDPAA
ncbi:pyridoxamine 5'-phosphate oxidase family protein [Sphingobacterium thalpophilum]|uniref:pyridoxamine 5'-phosphate oxidase family protein n=1 Tax=Sphingobacterium thalpophilum TaxID=259 RepID=UPI0024A6E054|nr:pyridoxamine 5'-phosphate oxidase family protein [Sphingobacterium thalpophilum]